LTPAACTNASTPPGREFGLDVVGEESNSFVVVIQTRRSARVTKNP
jgi:hypothetical protein